MLNNKFRTSLTRDEIIGLLLGWITGPDIALISDDQVHSAEGQEALDLHAYSIYADRESRQDDASEACALCLESGQSRADCRKVIDDFNREDEEFRRVSDEVDDEISKGATSMLRIDHQYSTLVHTCYTRKSVDVWVESTPELSMSKPPPKKSMKEQQEEAILTCIKNLGHDPECLDKPKPGHKGIKSEVRAKMNIGWEPFKTRKIFDNAWQGLRDLDKICERRSS